MERRFKDHLELAAEIVDRFRAIEWQHLPALELGFKAFPNYDLDFALSKLIEAERHYAAGRGERVTVTDDMALRDRDGYLFWMAETAKIHRNWPQYLLKPFEIDAWIAHYEYSVRECNQAGYHLREILSTSFLGKAPKYLTDKYNVHSAFYGVTDAAMLCKKRWYRMTQSRHHKPDLLAIYEAEFKTKVLDWKPQ